MGPLRRETPGASAGVEQWHGSDAREIRQFDELATCDSVVMSAAGAALHDGRGRRRGDSESRRSTVALVLHGIAGFPALRPLLGVDKGAGTPGSPMDSSSQHLACRIPLVRARRAIARTVAAIALFAALLYLPAKGKAQIVAPAGRTLFNRTVMIRTFVRIDNFDEDVPGHHVRQFINPYAVVWGAYPNLNLTFVAPLVIVHSENRNEPSQNFTHASFADGSIFARYDLLRKNVARGYTRLSPEIGVKVPSGGLFSTGSTDLLGTLVFSHWRDPQALIADSQFTYTTTNDKGPRMGNRWNYDVAYLYRLLPLRGLGIPALYVLLEMNGEHVRRANLNGMPLADSGGNLVFLSPGVEFQPNSRLLLEFSAPLPVVRDLNGKQLRPSSSFLVGFRWLF